MIKEGAYDLAVIGAGLLGSYAARAARAAGMNVVVIDSVEEKRASRCAAGLYCRAWLKRYGPIADLGVQELEQLYRPEKIDFAVDGRVQELWCVPPGRILVKPDVVGRVRQVQVAHFADYDNLGVLLADRVCRARAVYVAAGAWLPELETGPKPVVTGKAGSVYLFAERTPRARLWRWAPYRQALRFERPDDGGVTYFSDGSAILDRNYSPAVHDAATLSRARNLGLDPQGAGGAPRRLHGLRPYIKGGPYFGRPRAGVAGPARRLWIGAGTEKAGTVLGAAFARMLVNDMETLSR